jgi:methylated-DNA-[protein]-cysteine S-methyltransferase
VIRTTIVSSPVGALELAADEEALIGLRFMDEPPPLESEAPDHPLLVRAVRELDEYFRGDRSSFSMPLRFEEGTAFQKRVWNALLDIPMGETRSYGQIAGAIGRPTASRAVGAANGQNPLAIVVPCHRVIGQNGTLTGYGGGLERKRWLLDHERRMSDT